MDNRHLSKNKGFLSQSIDEERPARSVKEIQESLKRDKNRSLDELYLAYKNNEDEKIRLALLELYVTKYPEFLEYALSRPFINHSYLVWKTLNKKAKYFSQKYLTEIFKRIESSETESYIKNQLLFAVLEILKKNDKLFDTYIKRMIDDIAKYGEFVHLFKSTYQELSYNNDLKLYFLEKIFEYKVHRRDLSGHMSYMPPIVKDALKTSNATQVLNLLAHVENDAEGQLLILQNLIVSEKYLKVFMYLLRSKDKRVRELAKEKIKSLKD